MIETQDCPGFFLNSSTCFSISALGIPWSNIRRTARWFCISCSEVWRSGSPFDSFEVRSSIVWWAEFTRKFNISGTGCLRRSREAPNSKDKISSTGNSLAISRKS